MSHRMRKMKMRAWRPYIAASMMMDKMGMVPPLPMTR